MGIRSTAPEREGTTQPRIADPGVTIGRQQETLGRALQV